MNFQYPWLRLGYTYILHQVDKRLLKKTFIIKAFILSWYNSWIIEGVWFDPKIKIKNRRKRKTLLAADFLTFTFYFCFLTSISWKSIKTFNLLIKSFDRIKNRKFLEKPTKPETDIKILATPLKIIERKKGQGQLHIVIKSKNPKKIAD